MKLKLDENFDTRLVPLLTAEAFDVDSIRDEGLSGSPDEVGSSVADFNLCDSAKVPNPRSSTPFPVGHTPSPR